MFHYNQNRMTRDPATVGQAQATEPRTTQERVDSLLRDRAFYDHGRPCVRAVDGRPMLIGYHESGERHYPLD